MFRNWIIQTFPFLEDDFDALTDYELFCKMLGYVKKMSAQYDEFQKELNKYENYFNNLDVQEEINNKLDEMAESGELENLISQYIELATTYVYDNMASLKSASNLIVGSYARISGYYTYNDGGGAYYKIREITNADVVDEKLIVSLSDENLIAELIFDHKLNLKQLGAKADNTTDDSQIMQFAVDTLSVIGGDIIIPNGTYLFTSGINIPVNNELINIIGNNSVINCNLSDEGIAFNCVATSDNYCRITFKDLKINYTGTGEEVTGIKLQKVTERKIIDNVRITGFYNNIYIKDCWLLIFDKLTSVYATNDGLLCQDITNGFNFNSCIFQNNTRYNIFLVGRGHSFTNCDFSIYNNTSYNYFFGCEGVSLNGCYYEENDNVIKGFYFNQSTGISLNGCFFDLSSETENYNLFDIYNCFGIGINNCYIKANSIHQDDNSYLIKITEGSTVSINNNNFKNLKKVCYIENSQLNINNNKLSSISTFLTQYNHIYARIVGNIEYITEYENSILPHKEVIHLTINNLISSGNTSSRPSGLYPGQIYFNTETSHQDIYDGTNWITE